MLKVYIENAMILASKSAWNNRGVRDSSANLKAL